MSRESQWQDPTFQAWVQSADPTGTYIPWAHDAFIALNDQQLSVLYQTLKVGQAYPGPAYYAYIYIFKLLLGEDYALTHVYDEVFPNRKIEGWVPRLVSYANMRAAMNRPTTVKQQLDVRPLQEYLKGKPSATSVSPPARRKYPKLDMSDMLSSKAAKKAARPEELNLQDRAKKLSEHFMSAENTQEDLRELFPSGSDFARQLSCSPEKKRKAATSKSNGDDVCQKEARDKASQSQDESIDKMGKALDEAALQYGPDVSGWVKGMLMYFRSLIVDWLRSTFKSTEEQKQRFRWSDPSTYVPRVLRGARDVFVELMIWVASSAHLWYLFMTGLLYARQRICEYIAVTLGLYEVDLKGNVDKGVAVKKVRERLINAMDGIRSYITGTIKTLVNKALSFVMVYDLTGFGSSYITNVISVLTTFFADTTDILVSTWYYAKGSEMLMQVFVQPCMSEIVAYNSMVELDTNDKYDEGLISQLMTAMARSTTPGYGQEDRESLIDRAMRFLPGQTIPDPSPEEMGTWNAATLDFWEALKRDRNNGYDLYEKYNYTPSDTVRLRTMASQERLIAQAQATTTTDDQEPRTSWLSWLGAM